MQETAFHDQVISAIRAARISTPVSAVHLLYAPQATDPLKLLHDKLRDSAVIRPPLQAFGSREQLVRVVTLDCRRSPAYPSDPLLETSIALAYKEMRTWQDPFHDVAVDGSAVRAPSIYGWIVTPDVAFECAVRTASVAPPRGHKGEVHTMRWYEPEVLCGLWPSLDDGQKNSLLGSATWLMCGVPPVLQRYAAPQRPSRSVPEPFPYDVLTLRPEQWQSIFNSTVVSALRAKWHALCVANGWQYADDAMQQLHRHVLAAQRYRFDTDDLVMYAMTAMQLAPEALQSDQAHALLKASSNAGIPLRDALYELPDSFWERHVRVSA